MKTAALAILLIAPLLLASCGGDPAHFDGRQPAQRTSQGNAPLEGPGADDVINDVHHDRVRQNYEDRRHRRYYGRFD